MSLITFTYSFSKRGKSVFYRGIKSRKLIIIQRGNSQKVRSTVSEKIESFFICVRLGWLSLVIKMNVDQFVTQAS